MTTAAGSIELERNARGRVEVQQVRERQLLALVHGRAAEAGAGRSAYHAAG